MSQGYGYMPYMMPGQLPRPADVPANAQTFLAYIQEDKIYKSDAQGSQVLGVVSKIHDDLQADYDNLYATCKEYYEALVKAGIIKPEPTQEDIIRKQAEQLEQASEIIAQSAKTQQALQEMVLNLTAKIENLSCAKAEEPKNESLIEACAVDTGTVSTVENDDRASVGCDEKLPELPTGSYAGDSGEKSKGIRHTKGSGASSKRSRR